MLKGSVSINGRELETMLSIRSPTADKENDLFGKPVSTMSIDTYDNLSRSYSNLSESFFSPLPGPRSQRDQAALKLQKVYKSFRTRRQLADCAVLAEQRWLVSIYALGETKNLIHFICSNNLLYRSVCFQI